jgi:hypothetical protein
MSKKSMLPYFSILFVLMFVSNACGPSNTPAPTQDVPLLFTQAAQTIAAEYTQTALMLPTDTPTPSDTPAPSPTPRPPATLEALLPSPAFAGPTPFPVDPATANGCYNAALIADVTVPPGTAMKPGDKFTKTWRIMNTGTCDWNGDFKITFIGGDLFGSDTTKIRQKVGAGYAAEISLPMVAPNGFGTVTSNWQMATDSGTLFGAVFTISIALPGASASATASSGSAGCYDATLLSIVTDPAGPEFSSGDTFNTTFNVKNTGTCAWASDYKITFVGGDLLGSDTTKIRQKVGAGSSAAITLKDMVAPSGTKGATISSSWQMATSAGQVFGQVFTLQIILK